MMDRTRSVIEGLVREGSFKWVLGGKDSDSQVHEEMGRTGSGRRKWFLELSPIANSVVQQCSKLLNIPMDELRHNFDSEASDSVKHPLKFGRNFLEYCCFRVLALVTQENGHLSDKNFRRLTYDMMRAWEFPQATSQPLLQVDSDNSVGKEAFCRIAPAIPAIADVVTCHDLFDVLTSSVGGRLTLSTYEKYLGGLEREIKAVKSQSESSLIFTPRAARKERIIEVDGTVTTQPVLQHVGRLILTDYALYFEPLRVVSYDKAKKYDLSEDLKQVVKPELTGPWGTRLFDKAVLYSSMSLPEPVIMEFPELTGHLRRDYWLSIIREILYVHRFIRKFQIEGVGCDEILSKAVLGILRIRAIEDVHRSLPSNCENLLMFNLSDQLPGGDLILEELANSLVTQESDRTSNKSTGSKMHSVSALSTLSQLGSLFAGESTADHETGLPIGEIVVGEMTSLERAIAESRSSYKKVEHAQATVDGAKVEGIDTNLAVMKELLFPVTELGSRLLSILSWDDPLKSALFCIIVAYIICRGWILRAFSILLLFIAIFLLLTRIFSQSRRVTEVKVVAPPPKNTMEQLLAVQNAIVQFEEFIQDGNVILLKSRAVLLAILPQATDRVIIALVGVALFLVFVPVKLIVLLLFLEIFTRNSPPRKASTERWMRRLREWWFSIPAAPVVLEKATEEKKRK
ncbi:hypothetical protein EJ110_NYTH20179 [Nymphaea thermarum]|nr:hypothetical protein EJ110_NYTH20179 [Nymphaea thermarum]